MYGHTRGDSMEKAIKIILKNLDEKQLLTDLVEEFADGTLIEQLAPFLIPAIMELIKKYEGGK